MNKFKQALFLALAVFSSAVVVAQAKYVTKSGTIRFYSTTELQNVEATNGSVSALLDAATGSLRFSALMKGFAFEKALMQEHFNKSYVESDKYPKAEFIGSLVNPRAVNYQKPGSYPVVVKGLLSLHGEEKQIETPGLIVVGKENLKATSQFTVPLDDFKIQVPDYVKGKLAKELRITVDCQLEKL